jgi:hypothetical protein
MKIIPLETMSDPHSQSISTCVKMVPGSGAIDVGRIKKERGSQGILFREHPFFFLFKQMFYRKLENE